MGDALPSSTWSTWTTFGCLIFSAALISFKRASLESGAESAPSGRSLTATTVPDVSPAARYTSPKLPRPRKSVVLNVSLLGPRNVVPSAMEGIYVGLYQLVQVTRRVAFPPRYNWKQQGGKPHGFSDSGAN